MSQDMKLRRQTDSFARRYF